MKNKSPEQIAQAVMQSIEDGGYIKGIDKRHGEWFVAIPPYPDEKRKYETLIGPFKDEESADDFLYAEVGAPGARVIHLPAE